MSGKTDREWQIHRKWNGKGNNTLLEEVVRLTIENDELKSRGKFAQRTAAGAVAGGMEEAYQQVRELEIEIEEHKQSAIQLLETLHSKGQQALEDAHIKLQKVEREGQEFLRMQELVKPSPTTKIATDAVFRFLYILSDGVLAAQQQNDLMLTEQGITYESLDIYQRIAQTHDDTMIAQIGYITALYSQDLLQLAKSLDDDPHTTMANILKELESNGQISNYRVALHWDWILNHIPNPPDEKRIADFPKGIEIAHAYKLSGKNQEIFCGLIVDYLPEHLKGKVTKLSPKTLSKYIGWLDALEQFTRGN